MHEHAQRRVFRCAHYDELAGNSFLFDQTKIWATGYGKTTTRPAPITQQVSAYVSVRLSKAHAMLWEHSGSESVISLWCVDLSEPVAPDLVGGPILLA
jgi:hypothetical protein